MPCRRKSRWRKFSIIKISPTSWVTFSLFPWPLWCLLCGSVFKVYGGRDRGYSRVQQHGTPPVKVDLLTFLSAWPANGRGQLWALDMTTFTSKTSICDLTNVCSKLPRRIRRAVCGVWVEKHNSWERAVSSFPCYCYFARLSLWKGSARKKRKLLWFSNFICVLYLICVSQWPCEVGRVVGPP